MSVQGVIHRRADAVRDAVVYGGRVAQDRVETRWTAAYHLRAGVCGALFGTG